MVDNVSAEDRIKTLLEESRSHSFPEDAPGIKRRYKDTALVLFKQSLEEDNPRSYLSFGTRRSSAVSQYGNTPIVIRRSRSSNGELATVVEQVPSIRGRSSVSDYTLVEARENDEENSDSEDEHDTTKTESTFGRDEAVKEIEINNLKSKNLLNHDAYNKISNEDSAKSAEVTNTKVSEQTEILEEQVRDHEYKKSFTHYDLPVQRNKDREKLQTENHLDHRKPEKFVKETEERNIKAAKDVSQAPKKITAENAGYRNSELPVNHNGTSHFTPEDRSCNQLEESQQENGFKINNRTSESQRFSNDVKSDSSKIDHEAILRDYVQKHSFVNKPLAYKQNEEHDSVGCDKRSSDEFKFVELKIVESTDSLPCDNEGSSSDIQQSLTSDMLSACDDDDVVFIDANSPMLMRARIQSELSIGSSRELLHTQDNSRSCSTVTTPTPPKRRGKSLPESSPLINSSEVEDVHVRRESEGVDVRRENVNDVNTASDIENHSALLDLPVRSPTPPKRSPRRSPRTPKLTDKNKHQNSSLVFTSDEEAPEIIPKGTRSASPTSKSKETTKIFSFAMKREKSKSASSLNAKKGKGRQKLSSLQLEEVDQGVINPVIVADPTADGQIEALGKRVGVRSMVIDGTIKRNFIVIHPSDDSETIGLAPLSPSTRDKGNFTSNASVALSSVKSHITGIKSEKLESIKRISSKGDLKEELMNFTGNGGSLNLGPTSKSLRVRKSKKTIEHKVSSQSLTSEPTNSSKLDSHMLSQPPLALSEVDCDSVNVSSEILDDTNPKIVSKFCVIM